MKYLVDEILELRKKIEEQEIKISKLSSENYSIKRKADVLTEEINCLKDKNSVFSEKERLICKKYENKIQHLEAFYKRKMEGIGKIFEKTQIESLERTIKILGKFIEIMGKKLDFDFEIATSLCSIAENIDDKLLKEYIFNIINKKKVNEKNELIS